VPEAVGLGYFVHVVEKNVKETVILPVDSFAIVVVPHDVVPLLVRPQDEFYLY
jgi:hypothetical protein